MTHHYPDLGSASDWSCPVGYLIQPIRRTTQIWAVMGHQYGISALVSQTSFVTVEIVSFTCSCDTMTGSLKTDQVTASLQGGVVREPGYRKYLVLPAGRRSIRLKAGKVVL